MNRAEDILGQNEESKLEIPIVQCPPNVVTDVGTSVLPSQAHMQSSDSYQWHNLSDKTHPFA